MAITQVQKTSGQSAGAVSTLISTNFGATATANNLLIAVGVSDSTINTPAGYSLAVSSVSNCGLYIWYKVAAGTETNVAMTNVSTATCVIFGFEYSGLLTASVLDKTAAQGSTSGGNIPSGTTATTTQSDELAVAAIANFDPGAPVISSWTNSFTGEYDLQPSSGTPKDEGGVATKILSATGTQTTTATLSQGAGAGSTGCIATFKAAAAAAAGYPHHHISQYGGFF